MSINILMFEAWSGSGLVANKVPTSGVGTWLATGATNYSNGTAGPGGACFHSVTYTNSRITASGINAEEFRSASVSVQLFVRATTTAASTCYLAELGPSYVSIVKRVNGVDTQLAGNSRSAPNVESALQVSGSTIRVYIGGVLFLETTDTSITGPGYSGFFTEEEYVDEDTGSISSNIGQITISEPFYQFSGTTLDKNISICPPCTIGVGYLGSADITLMANAVVAALNATTIPVNVESINNADVLGTGTTGDTWRGVGV